MNEHFLNHVWVKRFKVQERPIDLNVTERESFIDWGSASTLRLNFKTTT